MNLLRLHKKMVNKMYNSRTPEDIKNILRKEITYTIHKKGISRTTTAGEIVDGINRKIEKLKKASRAN